MELLLQSLKNVFLIVTTLSFIIISLRNAYNGLLFYLVCLILCSFTGFERAIYYESYLVPCVLAAKVLFNGNAKVSPSLILLLLYVVAISLANNLNPFPISNPIFFGLVLLLFIDNIITNERKRVYMIALLWCYVLAKMLWYIIYSPNPFAIQMLGDRLLEVNSTLITSSDSFRGGLDPNYFGYLMGSGFLISILGFLYYDNLVQYFKHVWVKYLLLLVASLELFFSLKGLSRCVFLAEVGAICTLLLLSGGKNRKYAIVGALGFTLFVFVSGVWDMLHSRFVGHNSASRLALAKNVLSSMYSWNGTLGYLLGGGTSFSWNKYSMDSFLHSFALYSTHSSWLTILINYGVIGFSLFISVIIKKVKGILSRLKVDWLSRVMLVLFVYFSLVSMSLEPLMSVYGWLLLIAVL